MTSHRANEILRAGWHYGNFDKYMTEEEIKEVHKVWLTMPGWTCFYDALQRIARKEDKV